MIDAIESVTWTGRIEQVKEEPLMIIDGAHNNEVLRHLSKLLKLIIIKKRWIFCSRQLRVNQLPV